MKSSFNSTGFILILWNINSLLAQITSLEDTGGSCKLIVRSILKVHYIPEHSKSCSFHLINPTKEICWTEILVSSNLLLIGVSISSSSDHIVLRNKENPDTAIHRHSFPCKVFVLGSENLVQNDEFFRSADISGHSYADLGRVAFDKFIFLGECAIVHSFKDLKWKFCVSVSDSNEYLEALVPEKFGKVDLSGRHLSISSIVVPPYTLLNNAKQLTGGTFAKLFQSASQYYNFSYEMTTERKPTGVLLGNGTWTGMMGDVVSGSKDNGMCIHVTYQRWGHADFTTYVINERAIFLLARPQRIQSWTALLRPLSWELWLLYIIALLLAIPILHASFKADAHEQKPLCAAVTLLVATSLEQSVSLRKKGRIFMTFWLFFLLILSTCYKDKLMLYLTFPEHMPIPRNLEQVYQRPDFRVIFHFWGSTMLERFKNHHNPMLLSLGRRLQLEQDAAKCVTQATIYQQTLCLGVRSFLSVAMAKNVTLSTTFQSYQLSEELFFPIYLSFLLRRNSVYTGAWDEIAGRFRESALIPKWNQEVFNGLQQEGRKWMLRESQGEVHKSLVGMMNSGRKKMEEPLDTQQFLVVFALYIGLNFLCLLAFTLELQMRLMVKFFSLCNSASPTQYPDGPATKPTKSVVYPIIGMFQRLVKPQVSHPAPKGIVRSSSSPLLRTTAVEMRPIGMHIRPLSMGKG